MYICKLKEYVKKINYFVFIIHLVNNHRVSRRFFTETNVKQFKSGILWTITNITRSIANWKKEILHRCISNILFMDTEKLSKMQISLQVFFKDFADGFRITYLKNGFFWSCVSKILLIGFTIATNLKTGLSKKCFWKILLVDFKTATKIIYLKVH